MTGKITRAIIESFLKCKTKARLKFQGEHGVLSDYESFLLEKRGEARRRAIEWILSKHEDQDAGVLRDILATIPLLRHGAEYVLDMRIEDHSAFISFDALKKVSGASMLGDFHYVPVLFEEGTKIRRDQRLLLAILGTALGDLQGRQPEIGIVLLGDRLRGAKVHLNSSLRERARDILREIEEVLGEAKPPRLMLNNHCQQCEFRERCRHRRKRMTTSACWMGWEKRSFGSTIGRGSSRSRSFPAPSGCGRGGRG